MGVNTRDWRRHVYLTAGTALFLAGTILCITWAHIYLFTTHRRRLKLITIKNVWRLGGDVTNYWDQNETLEYNTKDQSLRSKTKGWKITVTQVTTPRFGKLGTWEDWEDTGYADGEPNCPKRMRFTIGDRFGYLRVTKADRLAEKNLARAMLSFDRVDDAIKYIASRNFSNVPPVNFWNDLFEDSPDNVRI